MLVIIYFKNRKCSSMKFKDGDDFMKYLKENGTKIRDFEILQGGL